MDESFALVDRISFTDPKGLLNAAAEYESDDPSSVFGMARCDAEGEAMYAGQSPNIIRNWRARPSLPRSCSRTSASGPTTTSRSNNCRPMTMVSSDYDEDGHDSDGGATDDFANVFDQDGDHR